MNDSPLFDHEKLSIYRRAIDFVAWSKNPLEQLPKSSSAFDQLDRASTSIPLNIAEGNGKWTAKDRCRFFAISRGSALECAAVMDVAVARGYLEHTEAVIGKQMLAEIVRMLIGLIKANDPNREFGQSSMVREDSDDMELYLADSEQEQE